MSLTINVNEVKDLNDSLGFVEPTAHLDLPPFPENQERGALAELSEVYRRLGFDAGYAQAARDQLESFVVTAESILREHPATITGDRNARQLLYAFVARIERRLNLFAAAAADPQPECPPSDHYVDGGLGI